MAATASAGVRERERRPHPLRRPPRVAVDERQQLVVAVRVVDDDAGVDREEDVPGPLDGLHDHRAHALGPAAAAPPVGVARDNNSAPRPISC